MGLVAGIFFFSGFAALLYEVVWMRQLTLIFGVSTYAVATILAIYMDGLALGSLLFGRWSDKFSRHLVVYGIIELVIGAYALTLPILFGALEKPYIYLFRLELPYTILTIGRGLLAAMVLLPPTILMGGTLPILARYLVGRYGDVGKQTAVLYFVNTAGAVAGCTIAGFFLLEFFGVRATTYLAAGTNFALAITAISLYLFWRSPSVQAKEEGPEPEPELPSAVVSLSTARLTLFCVGVSGFISLAYEVFWTRALLRYLHNSTYAFTAMLAIFLTGLTIGSAMYVLLPFRKTRPALLFGALEIGAGLSTLLSLFMFLHMPEVSGYFLDENIQSLGDSLKLILVRAGLILFLPALFFGATLPLASEIYATRIEEVGRSIGRVYSINTVGAVFGSLAASFILIPFLGMQLTLALLIAMNIGIGGALVVAHFSAMWQKALTGVTVGLILVTTLYFMPENVFRRTFPMFPGPLIFYKEGATDTVGVNELFGQRGIMYEDRRGTAATNSHPTNFVLGHLPVLLHPGEPETGLHICFGVGNSLSAFAAHESLKRVDSIELSPHVLEAAKYFWTNNDVINNPKVNTIIEDGRNFVMATETIYDVIEIEPPEPFTAGVINLYTVEFYEDIRDKLAEDGVFCQWIMTGTGSLDDMKMLYRAFYDVFPEATAWQQLTMPGAVLLIGTKIPLRIDYQLLKEKMQRFRVREDLALAEVNDPEHILTMFLFGPPVMKDFLKGVKPVTDDKTVLDFSMARHLGSGFGMGVFFDIGAQEGGAKPFYVMANQSAAMWKMRESILPYLTNLQGEDAEALGRRVYDRKLQNIFESAESAKKLVQSNWNRWPARK